MTSLCLFYNACPTTYSSNKSETSIMIDSGASKFITPELSYYSDKVLSMEAPIQGLSSSTKIKGVSQ